MLIVGNGFDVVERNTVNQIAKVFNGFYRQHEIDLNYINYLDNKINIVLLEKPLDDLLSFDESLTLMKTAETKSIMPIVIKSEFSICYGFLPDEFEHLEEDNRFRASICQIMNDETLYPEDGVIQAANTMEGLIRCRIIRNLEELER